MTARKKTKDEVAAVKALQRLIEALLMPIEEIGVDRRAVLFEALSCASLVLDGEIAELLAAPDIVYESIDTSAAEVLLQKALESRADWLQFTITDRKGVKAGAVVAVTRDELMDTLDRISSQGENLLEETEQPSASSSATKTPLESELKNRFPVQ